MAMLPDSPNLGTHLAQTRGIIRRYAVVNGFDGALTMLGLLTGFSLGGDVPLETVIAACLGAAVALSGQPALSDEELLFFVLSPLGLALFIVLLSLFSIIVFLEFAALTAAAWRTESRGQASVRWILKTLSRQAPRLFRLAARVLTVVLADHGEGLKEKGYFGHARHHDGWQETADVCLDADDWCLPGRFDADIAILERDASVDGVYGAVRNVFEGGRVEAVFVEEGAFRCSRLRQSPGQPGQQDDAAMAELD